MKSIFSRIVVGISVLGCTVTGCGGGVTAPQGSQPAADDGVDWVAASVGGGASDIPSSQIPAGCPKPVNVARHLDGLYDGTYLSSLGATKVRKLSHILYKTYGARCEVDMARNVTTDGDQIQRRLWVDDLRRERGSWSRTPQSERTVNVTYKQAAGLKRNYAVALMTSSLGTSNYEYYTYAYKTVGDHLREEIRLYDTCHTSGAVPIRVVTNVYRGSEPVYANLAGRKVVSDFGTVTYAFNPKSTSVNTSYDTREVRAVFNGKTYHLANQQFVSAGGTSARPIGYPGQLAGYYDPRLPLQYDEFSPYLLSPESETYMSSASYYFHGSNDVPGDGQFARFFTVSSVELRKCAGGYSEDGIPCAGPIIEIKAADGAIPPEGLTIGDEQIAWASCANVFEKAPALASCGGEASSFCLEGVVDAPMTASGQNVPDPRLYYDLHTRF